MSGGLPASPIRIAGGDEHAEPGGWQSHVRTNGSPELTARTNDARKTRSRLRVVVNVLHGLWALPCLVGTVLLGLADGHPPGIIFVPVAVAVWLLGHGVLWITRSLGEHGRSRSNGSRPWPVSVIAAVAGTGVGSFIGVLAMAWPMLGGAGLSSRQLPFIAATWAVHALAFGGLLTRRHWGRWLASLVAVGWGGIMAAQILDHLRHSRAVTPVEMAATVSIIILLLMIGALLTFGARPREFTGGR